METRPPTAGRGKNSLDHLNKHEQATANPRHTSAHMQYPLWLTILIGICWLNCMLFSRKAKCKGLARVGWIAESPWTAQDQGKGCLLGSQGGM